MAAFVEHRPRWLGSSIHDALTAISNREGDRAVGGDFGVVGEGVPEVGREFDFMLVQLDDDELVVPVGVQSVLQVGDLSQDNAMLLQQLGVLGGEIVEPLLVLGLVLSNPSVRRDQLCNRLTNGRRGLLKLCLSPTLPRS